MTAKEQLRERVTALTEEDAAELLRLLDEAVEMSPASDQPTNPMFEEGKDLLGRLEEAIEMLRQSGEPTDPVVAAFRKARVDDEPWTAEDEAAAAEGRADLAAGRTVPLHEAMEELEQRNAS